MNDVGFYFFIDYRNNIIVYNFYNSFIIHFSSLILNFKKDPLGKALIQKTFICI